MINLINGDCLESMLSIQDESVDTVLMDPPYCSGSVGETQRTAAKGQGLRCARFSWFIGDNMGTAGLTFLLRSIAFESIRVLKPSSSFLCFCDWRMVSSIQPAIESAGFRFQNLVVWDKGHMGLGKGFRAQHELILHFTAGKPVYYDKGTSNIIKAKRINSKKRNHQTEKPIDLLEKLLTVTCPPGGTVIDPFMGSGSTGVACKNLGNSFIGIERDGKYFEIAKERLA